MSLLTRLPALWHVLKPVVRPLLQGLMTRRAALPPVIASLVALIYGLFHVGGASQTADAAPPKGSELLCTVKRTQISDGDTLTAICDNRRVKVRLWGIDAPEMGQKPWGQRSREALQRLLLDSRAEGSVFIQIKDVDRYGRAVGVVKTSRVGRDVGLELVRLGHAIVYAAYNDSAEYRRVQAEAKANRRGIWATPGDHQDPAAWRRVNRR